MTDPLLSYDIGTVAVAGDGTTVTGTSTLWLTNVKPGYFLTIGHFGVFITDVADDTHLSITQWPGATLSGATYNIWKVAQGVFGSELWADVDKIVRALNANGFIVFVPPTLTAPDPSLGEENQTALQPTTGKMWVMSGGVWTFLGFYRGFNPRGAYDNAATYSASDWVSSSGSSYVWINPTPGSGHAPPNATYWQVLGSKGDQGNPGPAALLPIVPWATATAFVKGPPASFVSNGGSSYMCLVPHTSGTFATDLAAGKWGLVSQKGTDGSGTVNSVVGGTGLTGGNITSSGTLAVDYASKSDQQTGTATAKTVNPAHQQDHDSAAKAWAIFHWTGSTLVIDASYNISSISRSSAGIYIVNYAVGFATAIYSVQVSVEDGGNTSTACLALVTSATRAVGSVQVRFYNQAMSAVVDPAFAHFAAFGRQ